MISERFSMHLVPLTQQVLVFNRWLNNHLGPWGTPIIPGLIPVEILFGIGLCFCKPTCMRALIYRWLRGVVGEVKTSYVKIPTTTMNKAFFPCWNGPQETHMIITIKMSWWNSVISVWFVLVCVVFSIHCNKHCNKFSDSFVLLVLFSFDC